MGQAHHEESSILAMHRRLDLATHPLVHLELMEEEFGRFDDGPLDRNAMDGLCAVVSVAAGR